MIGHINMKRALISAILVIMLILPAAKAMADKADILAGTGEEPVLNVMLGKADLVTFKSDVADVMVANPAIVDVMALRANQLYIVGSSLGDTNIMVLDQDGNIIRRVNVHVQMDTDKLSGMIKELYPNESVKISALTDQLVLTGHVSTPAVSNSIANLVAQYASEVQNLGAANIDEAVTNMLVVGGEQQVMLKVRVLEASRTALKDLGLETRASSADFGAVGAALSAASGLGLTAPAQLGVLALSYNSGTFGPMSFIARALEEEGIVNTLAEPNLTAISGEQAGFLAGGEVPIPTEIDRNGNLVYEFRPFGVSLNFRPTVMSENRISMELTTEVSSASYDENLQLQGITVPTFNVRRADTTVELPSGGTLMIAGLLQSDTTSNLTQLPGIGKIPVVGDLLKSDSFQRNESELVVMVTPYLVRPFAQNNAAPATPETVKQGAADMDSIPRLSLDDLETLPEENSAEFASSDSKAIKGAKRSMALPAGLSQEPMIASTPLEKKPAEPEREKSALSRVFENNIKRTFESKKVNDVMKDVGSFGYMTE